MTGEGAHQVRLEYARRKFLSFFSLLDYQLFVKSSRLFSLLMFRGEHEEATLGTKESKQLPNTLS